MKYDTEYRTISFVNYASSIALIWLVTPSCPNCQCVVIICLELAINIDQPLLPALHLSNIFFSIILFNFEMTVLKQNNPVEMAL